jgi:hypothetical protein
MESSMVLIWQPCSLPGDCVTKNSVNAPFIRHQSSPPSDQVVAIAFIQFQHRYIAICKVFGNKPSDYFRKLKNKVDFV